MWFSQCNGKSLGSVTCHPLNICGWFCLFFSRRIENVCITTYSIFETRKVTEKLKKIKRFVAIDVTWDTLPATVVLSIRCLHVMYYVVRTNIWLHSFFTASITRLHIRFNRKRCVIIVTLLNVTHADIVCNRTKSCVVISKCYLLTIGVSIPNVILCRHRRYIHSCSTVYVFLSLPCC